MNTPRSLRFLAHLLGALVVALPLRADWKDDVGYTRLQQTFTSGVPTAVAAGVTQTEASDTSGNFYLPDSTNAEFSSKTIANKSSGSGASGHATTVGAYFYGNSSSLIPATSQIDAYNANSWLTAIPYTETRLVQNHSWIIDTITSNIDTTVSYYDARLDYMVQQTGVVCVVGVANGNSTTLPQLFCQAYNLISVGMTNGQHSAGTTTYDGAGRIKPDLVAPESATSFSTPQVSSASGLLAQKLTESPYSRSGADIARTTKALLLAGATKEAFPEWTRTTTQPIDLRYGAGELNVLLSYRILLGGMASPSTSQACPETAWANSSVRISTSTGNRTYFFDIPSGSSNSRFSAALVWLRSVSSFGGNYSASVLSDLSLTLYTASGFTIGSAVTNGTSNSATDNLEHIYLPDLPAGRYAIQVSSSSNTNTAYALAWRTSPTVTVAATTPTAREVDGTAGVFTLTRTGATTSPLYVPLAWSGTAVAGTHYVSPPAGVLIPAGSTTATVSITPIADSVAQGDRTVILTVTTDFSLSAGATPSATATIQDKPYDAWRFSHFTTDELANTAVSGDSADPDSDGLSNLIEYALGADPKTSDAATHTPAAGLNADLLTLTYTRTTSITDATYAVEWSSDLQSWSTGASVTETLSSTDNGNSTTTVVVRAITPLTTTPRQFLRLRVTR